LRLWSAQRRGGRRDADRELVAVLEPISPELVLVDPELARIERARLNEHAQLAELTRRPALDSRPGVQTATRRSRLRPVLLGLFVFTCGVLAGSLYGRERAEEPPSATPAARSAPQAGRLDATAAPRTAAASTRAAQPLQRARPTAVVPAKAVVERRILALAFTASKRYLPRSFVDPRTGLPKSNVLQVVCARTKRARGFDCALRMDGHRPVPVRYRLLRDGRSSFTWPRTRR
jgi:hypothetical protein